MRMSDFLGVPVRDDDGRHLGTVVDVRMRTPGPDTCTPLTIVGLLVSPHSGGSFLGYERRSMTRPAPIAQYLRWRHRRTFFAKWADVRRIGERAVVLRPGFIRYDPSLEGPS
jgi:sporulation protein YlmC with PRC-barrel domain